MSVQDNFFAWDWRKVKDTKAPMPLLLTFVSLVLALTLLEFLFNVAVVSAALVLAKRIVNMLW
jgi:hypothetical protein